MRAGDRKHQFADPAWRQRIGRDAARRRIHRPARFQRLGQRGRAFRFDADNADRARAPGGDAADQPAAANRDDHCLDVRRLHRQLETERALTEQRLGLVEGVHGERAGLFRPRLARRQRVGVAVAADDEIGAAGADPRNLGGRRDRGHENLRRHLELHRGERHGGAVIAARGRDHARARNRAGEQVREGATRLERSGPLELFELESDAPGGHAEVAAGNIDGRRPADMRRDDGVHALDGGAGDGEIHGHPS